MHETFVCSLPAKLMAKFLFILFFIDTIVINRLHIAEFGLAISTDERLGHMLKHNAFNFEAILSFETVY